MPPHLLICGLDATSAIAALPGLMRGFHSVAFYHFRTCIDRVFAHNRRRLQR